ncbi:hypothetical protein GW17_00001849 [Ensete ventricosum]|nr:hypothetical protein GW17_00001849 [Ensete ventricosum]
MSKNLVTLHLQKLVKRKVQTHCELEPAIGYRPSKLRPHHLPSLFESFQPRSWPELQRLVSSSLTHVLDRENRIKSEAREIEEFDPLAIPWFTVAVAFGDRNVNMGTKAEEEEEEVRSLGHCLLRRGRRSRGQKREHGHDIELDSLLGRASKRRHTVLSLRSQQQVKNPHNQLECFQLHSEVDALECICSMKRRFLDMASHSVSNYSDVEMECGFFRVWPFFLSKWKSPSKGIYIAGTCLLFIHLLS